MAALTGGPTFLGGSSGGGYGGYDGYGGYAGPGGAALIEALCAASLPLGANEPTAASAAGVAAQLRARHSAAVRLLAPPAAASAAGTTAWLAWQRAQAWALLSLLQRLMAADASGELAVLSRAGLDGAPALGASKALEFEYAD
jgi:hypothetical protein